MRMFSTVASSLACVSKVGMEQTGTRTVNEKHIVYLSGQRSYKLMTCSFDGGGKALILLYAWLVVMESFR